MKNKILSLVLALLMAASSASAVLANDDVALIDETAEEVAVVDEVEAGQYDKAIEFLANYGIMKGITDNDFGAELDVQRYQMALFVSRISTGWIHDHQWLKAPENWSAFTDISEGPAANYWGALSYASQAGIIEGYGDGKFGPEDQITYQNALTMVVRTLGYNGLDWPWGYIQKAVELGLTEGITGVSYTDNLTRGEVAQIIYNAMFAKMKDGSSLAVKNFGIEFGWEKVIVTASDLNIFVADNEKAEKGRESGDAYTKWNNSKKTADGYVAFQLLNDDGSLGDDTYYAKSTDFGFAAGENNHDDEAAVGEAYYVLFEKDADGLAKVVAYESLKLDTIWNEGKTDDNGDEQDYAIQEFLADYALVDKYTTNEYLNTTKTGKPEVMLFNGVGEITEEYVAGNYIAIDWESGDILEPVKDSNGKFVIDEDGEFVYDVAWYYNETLEKYYRYVFDEADKNGIYSDDKSEKKGSYDEVFAIDFMTDAEFEKFYESLNWKKTRNYKGFAQVVTSIATSAYSSLEIFDTNLDGVADRGIYESYRLGYFTEANDLCGSCGGDFGYKIQDVKTIGLTYAGAANKVVNGENATLATASIAVRAEGTACTHNNDRAWFVEGYTPALAEDGEGYAAGYVIYNYDWETGAIKVVKNIEDNSDDDSFVETGVVRAYNLKNGTITIGETQYHIDAYDELEGNAFKYVTKNWLTRACYTELLRDLFNQFVEYVVVDGELVAIRAKSPAKDEVIVVDSYAGLSSDGYIVVNGYSSADLKYDRFRIGSYDGWMKGDYYYYLTDAKAKASFDKGAIYAITSYDATNDVYYVELAGKFEEDVNAQNDEVLNYVVDSDKVKLDHAVTITADGDGYMTYTTKDGDSYHKMSDSDTYVIIPKQVEGRPYATIKVYTGKLDEDWKVSGNRINGTGKDDGKYVIINAEYEGFYDTYNTGLVLLLSDKYVSASYNGTDAEDWYLLGATEIEVEVFDLFTGNEENVILPGTNLDLEVGHVYFTQDGNLVEDLGALSMENIIEAAVNGYDDDDRDTVNYETAKYFFGTLEVTDLAKLFTTDKDAHKAFIMETKAVDGKALYEKIDNEKYRKNLDSVKIFAVEYEEELNSYDEVVDYTIKTVKAVDSVKAFNKVVDTSKFDSYKFYANYVYDIAGNDIVIYITVVEGDFTKVESTDEPEYTNPVKVLDLSKGQDGTDAYVEMSFGYTTETTTAFGTATEKYMLETVKLAIKGLSVENATHDEIKAEGWYFGVDGLECFDEENHAFVSLKDEAGIEIAKFNIADVYSSIVTKVYDSACDYVREVIIPVELVEEVEGVLVKSEDEIVINELGAKVLVSVEAYDHEADDDVLYTYGRLFEAFLNYWGNGTVDTNRPWCDGFVDDYKCAADEIVFAHCAENGNCPLVKPAN